MDLILQQIVNGIMLGGVYVMIAVAFTLIIGMLNFLNFTIPAIFMVSAMFMWAATSGGFGMGFHNWLNANIGLDYQWIVGALFAIAAALIASLIVERFTYRYMKARFGDATEHALPLVSSLGFLILFEHLVIMKWGTDPLTFVSPFGDASMKLGPLLIGVPQLISLGLSLLMVYLLSQVLKRTRMGRALRSIAEKPDTAPLMGVEVNRIVPVVFLMAGLLCAVAGILFTINYKTINPYVGDDVAVIAIAGMVLGGLGNIWGAIAGGMFVGMLEVLSIHFFGADIVKVPIWGLLLVILVIRPTGLFGASAIGKGKF
jgi:branched-chain amino acid transport system permease protein